MRGTGPHPHPLSSRVATATRTMALNPRSPSKHNQMITRFIKQSKPTKLDDVKEPPTKKQKLNDSPSTRRSPRKATKYTNHEIPDSDAEDGDLPIEVANEPHKTDLESALPPVKSDEEAIEEYAAFKASQEETKEETEELYLRGCLQSGSGYGTR
jgi:Fanconi-associated nuclease 1